MYYNKQVLYNHLITNYKEMMLHASLMGNIYFKTALLCLLLMTGGRCCGLERKLFAARNRALVNSAYESRAVTSHVVCGRDCSMDKECKSVNFHGFSKLCELNNATRAVLSEDFLEHQGNLYFDANVDTPLFSLSDDNSLANCESCKMLRDVGHRSSGVYIISPSRCKGSLQVFCDMETDGGGWIVFQRRQDGSEDFYRGWHEYGNGFGDQRGEFWLGNENLVCLTSDDSCGKWELRVEVEDWDSNTAWAKYSDFKISQDKYTLQIGSYDADSTAGNSFLYGGGPFTTKDNENDEWSEGNCAQFRQGAWWFKTHEVLDNCGYSHLNGKYYPSRYPSSDRGLEWYLWFSHIYSLKKCSMKLRETN